MTVNVNLPAYYPCPPSVFECIVVVSHSCLSIGTSIEYIWRAGLKKEQAIDEIDKAIEDLKKAIWYINDRIHQLEMSRKPKTNIDELDD
jgi:prefoldin subunit 5